MTRINRTQCKDCKWRAWFKNIRAWSCNWSDCHFPQTCKYAVGGEVVDRRGSDPENCLLFEKGNALRRKMAKKGGTVKLVEVQTKGRMPDTLDDGKQ